MIKMVEIRVLDGSHLYYEEPKHSDHPILLINLTGYYQDRSIPKISSTVLMHRYDGILGLVFADTIITNDDRVFTRGNAKLIRQIVNSREWKSIWVACDQGISRSPAVAIALDEHLNKKKSDLIKQYPCYNPYVYGILSKELSKGGK